MSVSDRAVGVRLSHSLSGVRTPANVSVHFVLLNRLLIYVWRPVSRTSLQPSQMLASTEPQADGGGPGGPPWNEAPNRDSVDLHEDAATGPLPSLLWVLPLHRIADSCS